MKVLLNKFFTGSFFKFIIVGGISAFIEYALYFLFKPLFGYLIGNVIAFGCTNIVTYLLTRRFVFTSSNSNKTQEAALYTVCLVGSLLTNQVVLWGLVEFATVDDRIAKAIAIGVTVIWNFFTRKHIVFRDRAVVPEHSRTKEF